MKTLFRTAAVVMAGLILSAGMRAAEAPPAAPPPTSPAPDPKTLDLKAALAPEQYQRAVQPILRLMELAAKATALYEEEMAKKNSERSEVVALGHRARAARFCLAASLRARLSRNYVNEEPHKEALTQQYEIPLRAQAVTLYLAVAHAYQEKRDLRAAGACYRRVLNLDPENAEAKNNLETIESAAKEPNAGNDETQSRPDGTGSGAD